MGVLLRELSGDAPAREETFSADGPSVSMRAIAQQIDAVVGNLQNPPDSAEVARQDRTSDQTAQIKSDHQ